MDYGLDLAVLALTQSHRFVVLLRMDPLLFNKFKASNTLKTDVA